jgi:hypothetical protein
MSRLAPLIGVLLLAPLGTHAAVAHEFGRVTVIVPVDAIFPGQSFPVIGAEFGSDLTVRFELQSSQQSVALGTVVAGPDGHFSTNFEVPVDFPYGYAEVVGIDDAGTRAAVEVHVGAIDPAEVRPSKASDWWQDPSVLVLGGVLVVLAVAVVWVLLRPQLTAPVVVAPKRRVPPKKRRA